MSVFRPYLNNPFADVLFTLFLVALAGIASALPQTLFKKP